MAHRGDETSEAKDEAGVLQRGRERFSRDGTDQTRGKSFGDSARCDYHRRSRSERVFVGEEKTVRVARVVDIGDVFSGDGAEFEPREFVQI